MNKSEKLPANPTPDQFRKRIDNLSCQRNYWKGECIQARQLLTKEAKKLAHSQLKEHEALEKVKVLNDSLSKITDAQVIQKQAFENLERQHAQLKESSDRVMSNFDTIAEQNVNLRTKNRSLELDLNAIGGLHANTIETINEANRLEQSNLKAWLKGWKIAFFAAVIALLFLVF
jgi:predicted  nucleic acid-binding Zn-ribbon protein